MQLFYALVQPPLFCKTPGNKKGSSILTHFLRNLLTLLTTNATIVAFGNSGLLPAFIMYINISKTKEVKNAYV